MNKYSAMYRRIGKIDLIALCRRTNSIHNFKNCSVIINRHYQCGGQAVYGFRGKQTVPFKCELLLLLLLSACGFSGKLLLCLRTMNVVAMLWHHIAQRY